MPTIHIPPVGNPVGEYTQILVEGCRSHPRVELHDDPDFADYVLLDFRHFDRSQCPWDTKRFGDKTILVDYSDSPNLLAQATESVRFYFKRSMVGYKKCGTPYWATYPRDIVPISYAIKKPYAERAQYPQPDDPRPIDVSCLFQPGWSPRLRRASVAKRVANPSKRYRSELGQWKREVGLHGQAGFAGRNSFQSAYFNRMQQSRIVVTCNVVPRWEGDYRLFEALASGAMVMVNTMLTPVKHPFVDGVHLVYYDNLADLEEKLCYYLAHENERLAIAQAGFSHALEHHRVPDRITEVLEEVTGRAVAETLERTLP